jgi:hypothetical protein
MRFLISLIQLASVGATCARSATRLRAEELTGKNRRAVVPWIVRTQPQTIHVAFLHVGSILEYK